MTVFSRSVPAVIASWDRRASLAASRWLLTANTSSTNAAPSSSAIRPPTSAIRAVIRLESRRRTSPGIAHPAPRRRVAREPVRGHQLGQDPDRYQWSNVRLVVSARPLPVADVRHVVADLG